MLDFTSALYLGLTHPSPSLRPWTQLTTGRPAVLEADGEPHTVGAALASLVGCEAATLRPSTLHAFWDLFGMIGRNHTVYVDSGAYPVARWGAERAAGRGLGATCFLHYNPRALELAIRAAGCRVRPVVVTDGVCPGCGRCAPIGAYLAAIEDRNGVLVIDDTQALGILGHSPMPRIPYGLGGGGSLRFQEVTSPNVVWIASLAKAFGVPVAMLGGSTTTVRSFESRSETRVHASPPSVAAIHAAASALRVNSRDGDARRRRLVNRVTRFRKRLSAAGISVAGGIFPTQTVNATPGVEAAHLHERLAQSGVRTVLRAIRGTRAGVTLLITARHSAAAIDEAATTIVSVVRDCRSST
jgi:8-amino-7-oxononanoate synthase